MVFNKKYVLYSIIILMGSPTYIFSASQRPTFVTLPPFNYPLFGSVQPHRPQHRSPMPAPSPFQQQLQRIENDLRLIRQRTEPVTLPPVSWRRRVLGEVINRGTGLIISFGLPYAVMGACKLFASMANDEQQPENALSQQHNKVNQQTLQWNEEYRRLQADPRVAESKKAIAALHNTLIEKRTKKDALKSALAALHSGTVEHANALSDYRTLEKDCASDEEILSKLQTHCINLEHQQLQALNAHEDKRKDIEAAIRGLRQR